MKRDGWKIIDGVIHVPVIDDPEALSALGNNKPKFQGPFTYIGPARLTQEQYEKIKAEIEANASN